MRVETRNVCPSSGTWIKRAKTCHSGKHSSALRPTGRGAWNMHPNKDHVPLEGGPCLLEVSEPTFFSAWKHSSGPTSRYWRLSRGKFPLLASSGLGVVWSAPGFLHSASELCASSTPTFATAATNFCKLRLHKYYNFSTL